MSSVVPIGLPAPATLEKLEEQQRASISLATGETMPIAISGEAGIHQRVWGLAARTDSTVTFEEYVHWAKIERAIEWEENKQYLAERGPRSFATVLGGRFSKGHNYEKKKQLERQQLQIDNNASEQTPGQQENLSGEKNPVNQDGAIVVTQEEWRTAARAMRTASWGTIFYLVTTDILGWSGAPFVFASVGYGPGVALYVIFGAAAAFAAFAMWKTFMGLDSSRFPMLSFGDPYLRVYGKWSRHGINVAQSIQQLLTVAVVILGNSSLLAQIAQEKICYIVVILIVALVGMGSGMIRTLQRLGWICNLSVWLNVVSFIIIMVASARLPIDYDAVFASTLLKTIEPVKTFAGPPPALYQQQTTGFASQFNAVNIMVYAYSGALLFIAFLAEMRHPWDFWKGVFLAQAFICVVYVFFGVFVYSQYGQYSIQNIGQVVQPYSLQTVGNVLGLLTGWFACFLYFNIGLKTVYLEVFQELLHFPPISTKRGAMMWYILGPIYWALAFIIAAGVPNLGGIVSFIGGLFSINFTYSFPVLMYFGYNIQINAALPGEGFDPATGITTRHDGGMKRWVRGYFKSPFLNTFLALYILAGLASSGMGTWAAVEGLLAVFGPGGTVATAFGCSNPTG